MITIMMLTIVFETGLAEALSLLSFLHPAEATAQFLLETCTALRREWNFDIFSDLKSRYPSGPKKYGFGIQVRGYEAHFWIPGGVRRKRRQGGKSPRFFRPYLGANMRSKILFYVARRAQDPSGEGPGGVFFRSQI